MSCNVPTESPAFYCLPAICSCFWKGLLIFPWGPFALSTHVPAFPGYYMALVTVIHSWGWGRAHDSHKSRETQSWDDFKMWAWSCWWPFLPPSGETWSTTKPPQKKAELRDAERTGIQTVFLRGPGSNWTWSWTSPPDLCISEFLLPPTPCLFLLWSIWIGSFLTLSWESAANSLSREIASQGIL